MRTERAPARATSPPFDPEVAWHDVECGGYEADLPLWRELAGLADGPVLDLGAGTGRVALDLASRGYEVVALDSEPAFVEACAARAREHGLRLETLCADARAFALDRRFPLVLAPMQVVQLLGDEAGRDAMLARVVDHLEPGGLFAPALADPFAGLPAADSLPPMADTGRREGWELASTPVSVREDVSVAGDRAVAIDRLRRAAAPGGETIEEAATIRLSVFPPEDLAAVAIARGLRRRSDRVVPETEVYVGSTVLMLEAPPA